MPILWFSLVLGESGEGNDHRGRGGWSPTVFGEEKFKKSCAAVLLISKNQRPRSGLLLEKKSKPGGGGFGLFLWPRGLISKNPRPKVGRLCFDFSGRGDCV